MRGVGRILLPSPIRPVPLLYRIRSGVIEPFDRGCGFSAIRNATIHATITLDTESVITEASRLEKQEAFQGNSRKNDLRLVHRTLSKCEI